MDKLLRYKYALNNILNFLSKIKEKTANLPYYKKYALIPLTFLLLFVRIKELLKS